ncbi:MAG: EAL domain-containing protein, partial [Eggerthellaceae bacterium]|nr:EAL domain-containing protein [Eggerthellaceae bacterium]
PNDNFTLVRWDIEKCKLINSLFGMEMGDRVLTAAAEALKTRMEGKGTYGRYEGDNFVACFPTGAMDAEWLVDDIAKQMNDVLGKAGLTQTLILAGGVYPIEDRNVGVGEMCDRAAMAMRTIKGDYARHVAAYDDAIRRQMLEEQDILDNMVHALENGEFEVYLQPVYSLSTERVASAEALVRWNRPGKGIVSPGVFIPLFEKNGFISRLDYQIWEQVCQILAYRKRTDATVVPISVNLSRKSLYDPNICDKITDLTKSYGVEPELFRIEITESAYMDNASQLIATVKQLQERGHTVLMDDFGSGYSSLNTLREIPVDVLKMDMKFMEGFERGGRVGTIMTSVLRMAKWLGIPVIAEGVETYEEYEFLRSIGCEYTQGFYLARPMTYEDFENHLSNDQAVLAHKRSEFSEELVNEIMGDTPLPHVFATLFDGIALFEFRGDGVEVLRATSGYFDLFGYDASTFRTRGSLLVDLISESDYNRLVDACHRAVEGEESPRASIEWPRGSGHRVMATVAKVAADMSTNFLVIMGFLRLPGGEG